MSAGPKVRGFTLLEVMVALALLAIGLVALADMVSSALRQYAYSRELTEATLLARGKMAELEEKYEDEGFKDQDDSAEGNFDAQGYAQYTWKAEVLRPTSELGPEQLISMLAGAGDEPGGTAKMIQDLLGTSSGQPGASTGGPTMVNPAAGPMAAVLQNFITQFGQALKTAVREVRLTVGWQSGKQTHSFTVTTHLVVVCAKAPGGARGEAADLCPNANPNANANPNPAGGGR